MNAGADPGTAGRDPAAPARLAGTPDGPAPIFERVAGVVGSRAALAVILCLAAGLRLAHVLALRELPLFDILVVDSVVYDAWAQRIAAGDWIGTGVFYQDPLYPYFLGVLYRILGRDLLLVRLVQIALGVGTCALTAFIAARASGRAAGNVAALLLAVYGPAIFNEAEVDKTALGVFLATGALALGLLPRLGARLLSGAVLGLAALTRGNLLLIAPVAALAIALEPHAARPDGGGWRARLASRLSGDPGRHAAAFLLAFAVVLAPVAWRNHHFSGEWIPTTYGAGAVFYTGNNPANASGGFEHVPFVRSNATYEEGDFRAAAEARAGRRLSPGEISRFWFGEGLRHILENPRFALVVTLRKIAMFVGDYEVPDAWDMYFLARYSPVLRLPLLSMAWLLALATLGAVAAWKTNRTVRAVTVFAGIYAAAVIAFFVFARYRLYVAPGLAVMGAVGLVSSLRSVAAGRAKAALPAVVAALAMGAFSVSGIGTPQKREHLYSFISLAQLHAAKGEMAPAKKLLEEALGRNPSSAEALCAMGRLYLQERDAPRAAELLRRCVATDPLFPSGLYWLAVAELRSGNRAAAEQALVQQLRIVPGHEEAALWLGLIRGK